MSIKRIFCTMMMAGLIATSATATQAQSSSRKPWPRGNPVGAPREVAAVPAPAIMPPATSLTAAAKSKKTAIAGSWFGTSGEGNRLLFSFTSDGVVVSSVQTEVSTNPELGVLTPGRGAWRYVGDRQFEYTAIGILYTIDTGEYLGYLKAWGSLTLDASGDRLSGTDRVEIYGPDGSLVFAVPPGPTEFTRIHAEPFE